MLDSYAGKASSHLYAQTSGVHERQNKYWIRGWMDELKKKLKYKYV